jgi:Holliday junction DNA helicase RuvA
MIIKLKGVIENITNDFIDLDVQGIVYRILMSEKNIKKIGPLGSQLTILIYEIYKEEGRTLIGFLKYEEREIFSDLLTVQGVGGKMAINIMSNLENDEIVKSINDEDSQIFTNISGVGMKLATRIINELKEKIKKKLLNEKIIIDSPNRKIFNDLVSCLLNLGFSQKICETTASYVISENQGRKLEELIPIALKNLSNPSQ